MDFNFKMCRVFIDILAFGDPFMHLDVSEVMKHLYCLHSIHWGPGITSWKLKVIEWNKKHRNWNVLYDKDILNVWSVKTPFGCRLYHGSGEQSPAPHRGSPLTGQSVLDVWGTKRHWNKFRSSVFPVGSSPPVLHTRISFINHQHSIILATDSIVTCNTYLSLVLQCQPRCERACTYVFKCLCWKSCKKLKT
jgi:hypothetical protein